MDDALLWGDNIEESFFQACHWLETCGYNGITLNPEKFIFAQDCVEFAGFEITPNSVRHRQKYLKAIIDFPTPKNITDVRSWFCLINQVSYAFSMADRMLPFKELLKPVTSFRWDHLLEEALQESKAVIVSEIEQGVRIFDPSKSTCLTTDWSKDGIGFWLFQKRCECAKTIPFCCTDGWKITLVGSRFTSAAESLDAPVETIESGMPDKRTSLPPSIRDYFPLRDQLSTVDGVAIYKDRIIVPPSLRNDILTALHSAHQGVTSMISRAETSVFWPGITSDIISRRNKCNHCNRMAPTQLSAPPTPTVPLLYPFQCVCADFFSL